MKYKIKSIFVLAVAISILLTSTSCKYFSNFIKEQISQISIETVVVNIQVDKSLEELISSIEIEEPYEEYYDRDEYTSDYQYYLFNDEEFDSIRDYSFFASVHYNNDIYIDPYTGEPCELNLIDYDHIISLHYANLHGADSWTEEEKKAFADNPFIGVDTNLSINRAKGDKGPDEWLPEENVEDYCYTWLVISEEYNLSISYKDMQIIMKELEGFSEEDLEVINKYND